MLESVVPALNEMWFRESLLADETTMSYNHAWGGTIPFPKENWQDWYDYWITEHENQRYYRYLKDENGFVGEIAYHYDPEYDGCVADVIIFARFRGKGYGAKGLEMLCAAAKENGVSVLYDDIAIDNPAIRLFLKQGFYEAYRTEEKIVLKKDLSKSGEEMDEKDAVGLFTKKIPKSIETKNTSHGETDFRETLLVDLGDEKIVVKLSANGFTDEKHLALWERITKEYRELGYYCPQFLRALDGTFPTILYKGRSCMAWGEEFSKYRSAKELREDTFSETGLVRDGWYSFLEDAMLMDAKVASRYFDYTDLPSAYCMFEVFDLADACDETTEDAERWLAVAKTLPEEYADRVERIWKRWQEARRELEKIYHQLPTSVFQADINATNVLLDEEGHFKGVYDFNIGGREVYINYIVRQAAYVSTPDPYEGLEEGDTFLERVFHALDIARKVYSFSELEKKAAPLLYQCIRPLWWNASAELEEAGTDPAKIRKHLDAIEYEQTRKIDFSVHMQHEQDVCAAAESVTEEKTAAGGTL